MSLSPSGPSAQSTNSSVASFDYDGFQCREVSFSTANAINFNDSDDFFATHKDSIAPSEMESHNASHADLDESAPHEDGASEQEQDDTMTGSADTTIRHSPQQGEDATPHQTPKASDTPTFSTPVGAVVAEEKETETEKNSPAAWLQSLATVDAISLLTPKSQEGTSTPAPQADNTESTPSITAPTGAAENASPRASPIASSIDQLLASPGKENMTQDKNNTPKAAEEPQPKPRFRNLKTSWGKGNTAAKKGPSSSASTSVAARNMLKKFKNKAAKPMRKHAARANKRKIVKTAAALKAKAKGRAARTKTSASSATPASSSSSSSSTAALKKALSKSKKSQHLSEFVPLRSSKPCTSAQEIPASLTKVPEHKFYDGYVSMAEGLVKFFSDIPQRFLSGEKSAKKEKKPTASVNRPKTTEELQMEQARIEKERFMAKRKEFLDKHPELAQQGSAGGFQKRSTYMHADTYELDPSLPYEEAVAKQAEALRKRAEMERQERNKQMKAGLKKVLDSTEGELGICRKAVKQPTEPTTPEFLRRALVNKQQKDMQRLTEMQETELMEKAQRQFKATGVPVFVTKAKPSNRSKRIEHVFVGARKFKSRPFKKPPTPKLERSHKKTEPKPFTRATLYQNPRDKQEKLKEQLQQEEEQRLKEHREFKARPFMAKEAPSVARPRRRVKPQPFKSTTLYRDPRQKVEQLAKQLEEEQAPQPFKARGMPVFQEFKVERPQTMVVAEPFELESVRRAEEHKRQLEEERQQREQEEEEQRRKREKKKPLSELTNNPHFDPQHAVMRKEMSLQRAKERMEADKVAREEQERTKQDQMEKERKEYRKMLNKVTFRRDMPIFPSPKSLRSDAPLVEPNTPDVVRPLSVRHRKPELPAYLRK